MKSSLLVLVVLLGALETARAQDVTPGPSATEDPGAQPTARVASGFAPRGTTHSSKVAAGSEFVATQPVAPFALPPATPAAGNSAADPAGAPPAAANPRFVYGSRDDFRWQLGLGVAVVRFRSSLFSATTVGTDTSITYFTNEWLGFEGRVTTGFGPSQYQKELVKYLGYGGGPKLEWRARKFEPFIHGIVGGVHLLPQTGSGGRNAVEFQAGGGVGYRFNPRLSVRVTVDYLRTHLFGQWQNSAQAALEAVLHF